MPDESDEDEDGRDGVVPFEHDDDEDYYGPAVEAEIRAIMQSPKVADDVQLVDVLQEEIDALDEELVIAPAVRPTTPTPPHSPSPPIASLFNETALLENIDDGWPIIPILAGDLADCA